MARMSEPTFLPGSASVADYSCPPPGLIGVSSYASSTRAGSYACWTNGSLEFLDPGTPATRIGDSASFRNCTGIDSSMRQAGLEGERPPLWLGRCAGLQRIPLRPPPDPGPPPKNCREREREYICIHIYIYIHAHTYTYIYIYIYISLSF